MAQAAQRTYPADFKCVVLGQGSHQTFRVGRVAREGDEIVVSDDDLEARYPASVVADEWSVGGMAVTPLSRPERRRGA